jgi:hypothetical protein
VDASAVWLQSKEHVFQAKATAEFAKLRRCQAELEVETGQLAFVGLSVVGSLRQVGGRVLERHIWSCFAAVLNTADTGQRSACRVCLLDFGTPCPAPTLHLHPFWWFQAVRLGNDRAAARLRSEFRVSDRRFWGIKVTCVRSLQAPNLVAACSDEPRREERWSGAADKSSIRIGSCRCASMASLLLRYPDVGQQT